MGGEGRGQGFCPLYQWKCGCAATYTLPANDKADDKDDEEERDEHEEDEEEVGAGSSERSSLVGSEVIDQTILWGRAKL